MLEPTLQQQKAQLERLCPCCGLDPNVTPHGICCDIQEFADYGSCYVMFFSIEKVCFLICLILALLNIYKIQANLNGDACVSSSNPIVNIILQTTQICIEDWITSHSVANYGKQDNADKLIMIGFFVLMVLVVGFFQAYLGKLASVTDNNNDVPSDWTVVVGTC